MHEMLEEHISVVENKIGKLSDCQTTLYARLVKNLVPSSSQPPPPPPLHPSHLQMPITLWSSKMQTRSKHDRARNSELLNVVSSISCNNSLLRRVKNALPARSANRKSFAFNKRKRFQGSSPSTASIAGNHVTHCLDK